MFLDSFKANIFILLSCAIIVLLVQREITRKTVIQTEAKLYVLHCIKSLTWNLCKIYFIKCENSVFVAK